MKPALQPVSVMSVGVGLPALRLSGSEIAAAWGGGRSKATLAVCDADEDTLTLAWRACVEALASARVDAKDVTGLWWGTTRPPFAEGPSHAFLAATLGIDPASEGALLCGSTHSGMEALLSAWDAIASGHTRLALVVASDALVPGLGTAAETTTGAAAVAMLLTGAQGDQKAPAKLVARASRSVPVVDRYRADDGNATGDAYDPRLFREEIYLPLLADAARATVAAEGNGSAAPTSGTPQSWAVADPDGKLAGALVKRLGGSLAGSELPSSVGDSGAAASFLAMVAAASDADGDDGAGDARTIGIVAYGGGRATSVVMEVAAAVPGAPSLASQLPNGSDVSYAKTLQARSQLKAMAEPIQMGLPPTGAAFTRGNHEMLLLQGARCTACGTISTPPSVHPACIGCGGSELETVELARRGTVVTFVVNQTMPPPFQAPLPLVVIDLEDGARLMVQGTPTDAPDLAVGDTVTLSLRRYALERGIPVYGYKASRGSGTAGVDSRGALGSTGSSAETGVPTLEEVRS